MNTLPRIYVHAIIITKLMHCVSQNVTFDLISFSFGNEDEYVPGEAASLSRAAFCPD